MKTIYFYTLFLAASFLSSQNLLNGLQACYPLDLNANNGAATGSALDGTLKNVSFSTGHTNSANTAVQFAGNDSSYILLPNSPLIKPTGSLTVSGWYYVTSTAHQDLIFTKNTCSIHFNAYNFMSDGGAFQLVRKPGLPGSCDAGALLISAIFPINTWHHVVFYTDNVISTMIVDNNLPVVLVHNISFDYDPLKEVILGGTNELAANNPFSGKMDNVRFYNRALTPSEISLLYTQDPSCNSGSTAPTASFSVNKTAICRGESVTFTDQSLNNPTSWSWLFPGGTPASSTSSNPVVTYSNPGTYNVVLTTSNSGGSSTTGSLVLINVSSCVGLAEEDALKIELFPNPSQGKLLLRGISDFTYRLFDPKGRSLTVPLGINAAGFAEFDLSGQADGLYFLQIFDQNGERKSRLRFVLEK